MWSVPPRRILVPVDFSEASATALRVAAALAARTGGEVVAFHAESIDVPPYFTHDQLRAIEQQRAEVRLEAERYLKRFVQASAPAARAVLTDGVAVPAILAASQDVDLLVMGTHGRRGPTRWWAGSVTERVVRESTVPVLVVRASADETDPARVFSHLVSVAGPEFSGDSRRLAEQLAAAFGGTVDQTPVASLADLTCLPGATMMTVTIGRHHGHTWFGDVAERLVRSCPLPMLFVPAGQ